MRRGGTAVGIGRGLASAAIFVACAADPPPPATPDAAHAVATAEPTPAPTSAPHLETTPVAPPSASSPPHRTRLLPEIAPAPFASCTDDDDCSITLATCCPNCGFVTHDRIVAVNAKGKGRHVDCRSGPHAACLPCASQLDCSVTARCWSGTCRAEEDIDLADAFASDPMVCPNIRL